MRVFSITSDNQVQAFSSEQEVPPGGAIFRSAEELATAAKQWPTARLVQVWNQLPGAKPVGKFTDRMTGVRRLWEALRAVRVQARPQLRKTPSKRNVAPATAKQSNRNYAPGKGTKTEKVLALLREPTGATLASLMRATHWQAHSVRGFISGQLGKRTGLRVKSFRRDGDRVYRLRP
jgi:hypothetical protein